MSSLKYLKEFLSGEVIPDEKLSNHTTFKIGGKCDCLFIPKNLDDLIKILKFTKDVSLYVIGNGSNILVRDEGINGFCIKLSNTMNNIEIDGVFVKAGAGIDLYSLNSYLADAGLSGIEFTAGIPGTLGGAIYMNSGADGENIGKFIKKVEVLDRNGEVKWLSSTKSSRTEEFNFGYRESKFKNEIILSAVLELQKKECTQIREKIANLLEKRKTTLPLDFPSAGCIFKNPPGNFAGKLIEECGLKGTRSGDAIISEKHANFILNLGNATFKDVYSLINKARDCVKKKFGISLELEVKIFP